VKSSKKYPSPIKGRSLSLKKGEGQGEGKCWEAKPPHLNPLPRWREEMKRESSPLMGARKRGGMLSSMGQGSEDMFPLPQKGEGQGEDFCQE